MEFVAIYTNSRLIHKEKLAKRSQYDTVMWIKLTAIKMDRAMIMAVSIAKETADGEWEGGGKGGDILGAMVKERAMAMVKGDGEGRQGWWTDGDGRWWWWPVKDDGDGDGDGDDDSDGDVEGDGDVEWDGGWWEQGSVL
jgi:hypothetical protein